MSRLLQVGLATALAAAAHIGIFAALPGVDEAAASQAAGEEGLAEISLAPAPEALENLIAAWDAPPETAPEPLAPEAPLSEAAPKTPEAAAPLAETIAPPAPEPPVAESAPARVVPPEPVKPAKPEVKAEKPVEKTRKAPEKPAKQAASAPAPGQKAKGKGKGAVAGEGGADQTNAVSAGQKKKLQAEWGAKIRSRIAKSLKRPARQIGGTVVLSIVVAPDGSLRSARIAQSSGDAGQDKAALAAVTSAGRFPKAPEGVPETSIKVKLKFDK